ncbi:E3 ubiquitin-protein ligase [Canna indica]|uniref:RING-type E3 ubiquitin transferase n=1 Tax=Canna indica TaxID=4628 RepID=A0AAQ3QFW0_9LILI|nr:E3 ubiquitin-protein ligase [Canna indica]
MRIEEGGEGLIEVMARFSLEEDEECEEDRNPNGKKRSRRKGGGGGCGENLCDSGSSKKGKKRGENDEAIDEQEDEEGKGVEEEEEEELKDGDRGEVNGKERGQSSSDGGVCVRMDPDLLDCSICYEPLRPPIFQCQNGHVACSSCCSKLFNKCHICSHAICYSRCLILEKVIESTKFSCMYADYGCNRSMCYTDKGTHEETCIYAPCSCPARNCYFCGSREMLSAHFINFHEPYERFSYNQTFKVELDKTDPFRALHGEDKYLFLLLNDSSSSLGSVLSMVCFRPRSLKWDFLYELTINMQNSNCNRSCLQFESLTSNITVWKGFHPRNLFLLVPPDLRTPTGKIILDVCIRKIKRTVVK